MNCDWAEKISLLIDGELGREETRATSAHIEACAPCRRMHADFLSLREAVVSYPVAADERAASDALAKISAAGGVYAPAVAARPAKPSRRESWRLPRLTPAMASAVAAVVLAAVAGLIWSLNRGNDGHKPEPQLAEQREAQPPREAAPSKDEAKNEAATTKDEAAPDSPGRADGTQPSRSERAGLENGQRRVRDERAGVGLRRDAHVGRQPRRTLSPDGAGNVETALVPDARRRASEDALREFRPLFVAASSAGAVVSPRPLPEAAVADGRETTRHLEQAQVLLRSIRNARADESSQTVADERRRSQKLLYRNIVLRREAARTGNASVEHALESLEPILIDIANLPERPAREEVGVIQERMRKKDIVAVLQANIAAVPRTN